MAGSEESAQRHNIGILIQIRMSSSRLPGKALLLINGKTVLCRLIERIKGSKYKNIIISTSDNPADSKIVEEAERLKIDYFRGSEFDCLDRFIKTAQYYESDIIVRVTGDNPFTDPLHIDRAVSHLLQNGLDYAGTKGLPVGAGAEAMRLYALKKAHRLTSHRYHREHITSFIYQNPDKFKIAFICPSDKQLDRPDIRLTMDTKEDFGLIKKIYDYLGDLPSLQKIIELFDSSKEFKHIKHIRLW